jgi:CRISPR/Cas system-associated exonuclease Cas4 (RecB family)
VAPQRIIGVEVPFSVDLVLEETGEVLPCKLSGIFDLIESDEEDTLVIVELKTSSKRFSDDQIDLDLQGTLYSYALKQIRFHTNGEDTLVRYDQLLKQKTPSMETYYAVRGNVDFTWAYHLVRKVLRAIDHEVFHPIPGWQCKDCPYGKTCQQEQ